MMTLGTVGAFGFPDFHPPEVIGLYAEAGCTVVQIYRNRDKRIGAAEIVEVCDDLPVTIDSLHAHFGDDLDPSSEDEPIRLATVEAYAREAEYCLELGGGMIVIHPSPARAPAGDLDRRYHQLRRSLEAFGRIGERTGVVFAVENMPPYHPIGAEVNRLVEAIAALDSSHVAFLLDFGHAHMTCGAAEAVRVAGAHLRFTHVHDNDGANDTHRLPYRGNLPWDDCREALRAVGYAGVFMLEVFESADDLRRLLDEDWKRNIRSILKNGDRDA